MNDENLLTESAPNTIQGERHLDQVIPKLEHPAPQNHKADAKQLRVEQVGRLLDSAYQGASTLKLTKDQNDKLRADFPDEAIEIRPHDGIIYISHMLLRERLWDIFGGTEVAEICRERMVRNDTNEVAVDLVLMIKGKFVAEGIGTAKYHANNPKTSFGDVVESAWSEAYRRCCKKIGVGTQVWRPLYIRDWLAKNAVQHQGKWQRQKRSYSYVLHESPNKPTPDPDWPDAPPLKNPEADKERDDLPF